ncbi:MAG: monovalent cation/H+ antiporter complex subunit F [Christensenellales bacterium]
MTLQSAYHGLYVFALAVLMVYAILCFIRAVKGPSVADRIVAINMIGTQVIIMIGLVGLLIGEGYLTDVALIYAMISFLAVVVLCKVYMGVYLQEKQRQEKEGSSHA